MEEKEAEKMGKEEFQGISEDFERWNGILFFHRLFSFFFLLFFSFLTSVYDFILIIWEDYRGSEAQVGDLSNGEKERKKRKREKGPIFKSGFLNFFVVEMKRKMKEMEGKTMSLR